MPTTARQEDGCAALLKRKDHTKSTNPLPLWKHFELFAVESINGWEKTWLPTGKLSKYFGQNRMQLSKHLLCPNC